MKMNLLTYWQYGINTNAFKELMLLFEISEVTYMYDENVDVIVNNQYYRPMKLDEPLCYYESAHILHELDGEILEKIAPYEQEALDIINRRRRSWTSDNSYSSLKHILYVLLRFWNNYIKEHNIGLYICTMLPHIPQTYIPYLICKINNIPFITQGIIPFTAGEKANYILRPDIKSFDSNISSRFEEALHKYKGNNKLIPLRKELLRYFGQYDSTSKVEKRVIYYNEKNSLYDKVKQYADRIKIYIHRKDYKILVNKARYLAKIKVETNRFLKKVEKLEEMPVENQKFILFALHLQPEATTLPGGGFFNDQLLAIKMLSSSLPDDTFLYVKEHPSYWMEKGRLESVFESRNVAFYNEIKTLKNVILIKHEIPSNELLEKCLAVVTITGTIGFEAIYKGKPVLTFGPTFYEDYPSVFRIKSNQDCNNVIDFICKTEFTFDRRDVACYLLAIQKYVVPMGFKEKNFLDNGAPSVSEEDVFFLINRLYDFYEEYYSHQ